MSFIDEVMSHKELRDKPPILIDIGSSGELDKKWRTFAKYSICIAFDPDSREMGYINRQKKYYKALHVLPAIVHESLVGDVNFYLTQSPYCSSTLPADEEALAHWKFADAFKLLKKVSLPATTLQQTFKELNIEYVDWFKTDSQGTDLKLFKSMGDMYCNNVIVAEFEPGLIDAYKGEDKAWHVLSFMETKKNFILTTCKVLGDRYLPDWLCKQVYPSRQDGQTPKSIATSPAWVELTFMNTLNQGLFSDRQHLLAWVFAMTERQYGLALAIAEKGARQSKDPIFKRMSEKARQSITWKKTPWWYPIARAIYLKFK
ncbi:MAG: hypothetical protein WCJ02_02180 [bacterium]